MTKQQVDQLPVGVYEIILDTGLKTLAAVGQLNNGSRWLHGCNYITTNDSFPESIWDLVASVRLIKPMYLNDIDLSVPDNIRKEKERFWSQIAEAEEGLKKLREVCKHENTFEGNYSWRPGTINRALICHDCGNCLKLLDIPNIT